MDEAGGTMALDASGSNLHGTYVGTMGRPPSRRWCRAVMFPNPRSREFTRADSQYVRLSNMPGAMKPTAEITIALWYRATTIDGSDPGSRAAAELVSGGSAYILRLLDTDIEILKRVQEGTGISFARCYGPLANPLDGNWHHVVGVSSAAGLKVYIDGAEKCSNTQGQPISYDANIKDLLGGPLPRPRGRLRVPGQPGRRPHLRPGAGVNGDRGAGPRGRLNRVPERTGAWPRLKLGPDGA